MCIQCLDASAFAKGFTGCIVVLYPELLEEGACVPLSVSAEVVLRSIVFAELDTVLGSTIRNWMGKDCGETLTVPQVVSTLNNVVFRSCGHPPLSSPLSLIGFFYCNRFYSAVNLFICQYFCDLFS